VRRLAIVTIVMLALLPLRWFKILATPAGTLYLHEVGFFGLALVALVSMPTSVLVRARDDTIAFTLAMTAGFTVWAGSCIYAGVSLASLVKQVGYLVAFLVLVGVIVSFAESEDQTAIRVLRWAGVVTTCTLIVALGLALAVNHIQPTSVLASAVRLRDPSLIESEVFRPAFAGFGYDQTDTVSQLRHEVFAGLLVSLLVASWAQQRIPFRRTSHRLASQAAVLVSALLLLVSLSRSVQLAAIAWPLLAGLRVVLRGAVTRRAMVSTIVVSVVGVVVAVSGLLGVVIQRITQDSSSYDERGAKLSDALTTIGQHPFTGGFYDDSISSHNFVLDAWLRGGIVMAALMLLAMLLVVGRLCGNIAHLSTAPAWLVPGTAVFVLPLVRMFTIGAGLMTPPEWVALAFGFAVAIVYGHERRAARRIGHRAHQVAASPSPAVVS
jgi:hypothetical protein